MPFALFFPRLVMCALPPPPPLPVTAAGFGAAQRERLVAASGHGLVRPGPGRKCFLSEVLCTVHKGVSLLS